MSKYKYPVYATQGGGLARNVGDVYIFVEKPNCPGLDVGDTMPSEWSVVNANQAAIDRDFEDQFFDEDGDYENGRDFD